MDNFYKNECHGCKSKFTNKKDHPSIEASKTSKLVQYGIALPECAATFTEILAIENLLYGLPTAHRFIVDAYAAQHPPYLKHQLALGIKKQLIEASVKSISMHLISLYAAFEKQIELTVINNLIDRILANEIALNNLEKLEPPNKLGKIKINHFKKHLDSNPTLEEYSNLACQWAYSTWLSWSIHHKKIGNWYKQIYIEL